MEIPAPNYPIGKNKLVAEWHEWRWRCIPNTMGFDKHCNLYQNIVTWIKTTIPNYSSTVMWDKVGDGLYFSFKDEKDYTMFLLKWA